MAELGLGRLALQELQVVDHQHVDAAQRLLEGERGLGAQRRDEAVHELLGGEIEHLALGAVVAGPGDGLQQVRLAEADAGVDVERIEHHRLAAARHRHLLGGGVRQRVGAADHEGVEGQPQIERRAAERVVAGGHRRVGGAQFADVEPCRCADRGSISTSSGGLAFGGAVRITALRTLTSIFCTSGPRPASRPARGRCSAIGSSS